MIGNFFYVVEKGGSSLYALNATRSRVDRGLSVGFGLVQWVRFLFVLVICAGLDDGYFCA